MSDSLTGYRVGRLLNTSGFTLIMMRQSMLEKNLKKNIAFTVTTGEHND